jgi:hypothetical protein
MKEIDYEEWAINLLDEIEANRFELVPFIDMTGEPLSARYYGAEIGSLFDPYEDEEAA